MLQDINLLETISHATHERIPERIVHAKGAGAYGVFEVTKEMKDYTSADFLSEKGKKTELFCRFSTVAGGKGSADTVRDTHGFAFKLYTEEGNLDWVFFSQPVFPIRDGGKFPSFMHCQKGVPKNNLFDSSAFWNFFNHNSEAFHALMMIFTDRGTPESYQDSEIFSLNTYKFTKPDSYHYVKIHIKPINGVKTLKREKATKLAGEDPDYLSRSLFNAIEDAIEDTIKEGQESKKFPMWKVYAQIITPKEAETLRLEGIDIFDPTKVIPHDPYKLVEFGTIKLNKNPENFFSEVEGASFSPTAIVPGWDVSPDPILQTRLFAYGSAARYRLGINFIQSEVNKPKYSRNATKRDGAGNIDNLKSLANYIPGDHMIGTENVAKQYEQPPEEQWDSKVVSFDSKVDTDIDYRQPRKFWFTVLKKTNQQDSLIQNLAASLCKADEVIWKATLGKSRPPRS